MRSMRISSVVGALLPPVNCLLSRALTRPSRASMTSRRCLTSSSMYPILTISSCDFGGNRVELKGLTEGREEEKKRGEERLEEKSDLWSNRCKNEQAQKKMRLENCWLLREWSGRFFIYRSLAGNWDWMLHCKAPRARLQGTGCDNPGGFVFPARGVLYEQIELNYRRIQSFVECN